MCLGWGGVRVTRVIVRFSMFYVQWNVMKMLNVVLNIKCMPVTIKDL